MPIPPFAVNPPLNYGHDLSLLADLDPAMVEVDGRTALAQALARRIQTPRGTLLDDPNYGTDVTGEIDADLTPAQVAAIAGNVDQEFLKDERVLSSATTLTTTSAGGGNVAAASLTLTSNIVDSLGPFKLTLLATAVTVSVLQVTPS
ncbi:MAG: hypothetical protein NVS3B10_00050 [Polyangiales bacterium]